MIEAASLLRVILLTHGGAEKVLERLAALEGVRVVGVFVETDVVRRYPFAEKMKRSVRYDGYAATLLKLARKVFKPRGGEGDSLRELEDGRDRLAEIARALGVPVHFVGNYHAAEAIALMREAAADLGVIYGTNIIKESVFRIPRLGSINLHQGLAPFYRGGPPIFWELFNGETEVGLTVHFVESKVDSGEIVLQERVPLEYDYQTHGTRFEPFITNYAASLKERCASLIAEAVRMIADGTLAAKAQDTTLGKRYRLPIKREKDELRRRLRGRYASATRRSATGKGSAAGASRAGLAAPGSAEER